MNYDSLVVMGMDVGPLPPIRSRVYLEHAEAARMNK